jgi:hypothetical protein
VINELVPLGGLNNAVQGHDAAKDPVTEDDKVLVFGPVLKKQFINPEFLALTFIQCFKECVHC